jgi:hypothetical protein
MEDDKQDFKPSDVLGNLFELAGQACMGLVKLAYVVFVAFVRITQAATEAILAKIEQPSKEVD